MALRALPLFLLAALAAQTSVNAENAYKRSDPGLADLARAVELLVLDKNAEALPYLNKAIKARPNDYDALAERARCAFVANQYRRALDDLNAAIALKRDLYRAYSRRGYTLLVLGNYRDGVKDLTTAINANYVDPIDQTPSVDYLNRSKALRLMGRIKEADEDAKMAKQLDVIEQARMMRRELELNEAKKKIEQALKTCAKVRFTRLIAGVVYLNCGLSQQAFEQFDALVKITPDTPFLYYFRAESAMGIKNYSQAAADYDAILRLNPRYAAMDYTAETGRFKEGTINMDVSAVSMEDIHFLKARALKLNKQPDRALAELAICRTLAPADEEVFYAMSEIYLSRKDYKRAIDLCTAALKIAPKKAAGLDVLCTIYEQQGKLQEAIANVTNVRGRKSDDLDSLYLRAHLYTKAANLPKAIADYSEIISISGVESEAYKGRAELNLKLGKKAEALRDIHQAAQLDPIYAKTAAEYDDRLER